MFVPADLTFQYARLPYYSSGRWHSLLDESESCVSFDLYHIRVLNASFKRGCLQVHARLSKAPLPRTQEHVVLAFDHLQHEVEIVCSRQCSNVKTTGTIDTTTTILRHGHCYGVGERQHNSHKMLHTMIWPFQVT